VVCSLINSLNRSKAVGVGATPGFTKVMQEVQLDKKVKLLDCPGIVFASGSSDDDGDITLRNCVRVEKIEDPVKPIEAILKRCKPAQLMVKYKIPVFSSPHEFLSHVARRRGKLLKVCCFP
jgi:nuclear GTP-binding protein